MITLETLTSAIPAHQTEETLRLTAIIDTALCVGAGGSSGSLADKPILKNAEGRLVIPASQLKGRLRHECEKLARGLGWSVCESPVAERMCPQRAGLSADGFYKLKKIPGYTHHPEQTHCLICQIFGNPSLPARIQLSDLICTERADAVPTVLRPGVSINRRRRTAEEKKLYFLETSPANAALAFTGSLTLQGAWPLAEQEGAESDSENFPDPFAKALILTGLKHVYALGGGKSTGLGWLSWQFPEPLTVPKEAWSYLAEGSRNNNISKNSESNSQVKGGAE